MRQFCLRKDNQLSKETIWCWSGLTWRGNPSCRCLRSECSCRTRSTRSPSAKDQYVRCGNAKLQVVTLRLCDVKIQNTGCDFVTLWCENTKKHVWRLWYENTKIHVVTLWLCDVKIQKYRAVFNNWPSQFWTHLKQCQSDNQSSCSINF